MPTLTDILGSGPSLSAGQECARAVVIFAYGLLAVRVAGRRVFGKWSALDIVVSVVVGSNLSRALTGGAPVEGTLLATTLLLALHWLLAHAAAHSRRLSEILEGSSIVLARNGTVRPAAMRGQAVSEADLGEALRSQGLQDVAAAREITLEPSSRINVLRKER